MLTNREPHYKKALNWLHFSFTGDPKGHYVAPANTKFSFASPVEGEPLFSIELDRLQTLYPGAYTRGNKSMSGGAKLMEID